MFNSHSGRTQPGDLRDQAIVGDDGRRRRVLALVAPTDFRLDFNRDAILGFIYELRRQAFVSRRFGWAKSSKRRPSLYINLDEISQIDLAGALLLTAEFDRIRIVLQFRPVLYDHGWNAEVRAVLFGLGLNQVIDASRVLAVEVESLEDALSAQGIVVLPFQSGAEADPREAKILRDRLFGACEGPGAAQPAVYDGLVEAFTNAVAHAYPNDIAGDGLPRVKRWWAGALVDQRRGLLHLVAYDQGVGIPATLPARSWFALLEGRLPERTDAALLQGALEYGRSGTNMQGRGNGLWRMCELTDRFAQADVRFTSGKATVTYLKGGKVERATLQTRFCGTMIRWRAQIDRREAA